GPAIEARARGNPPIRVRLSFIPMLGFEGLGDDVVVHGVALAFLGDRILSIDGAQLATVFNVAEEVTGTQIGLINIGAEESKGTDLQKDAYDLLLQSKLNFVGNVEPRDLPFGACDVAVADGWTGNIVLKTTEGTGLAFSKMVKRMFLKNALTKIGSLAMRSGIRDFKRRTDYAERGGAPLLGITKPVIKAHGSSGARAFRNALAQAKIFYETDVNGAILAALAGSKEEAEE
ncbi:MAG TPA: hypothetical protein PLP20_06305, partial [Oscillospiraceae bacterium]|nr:hypothetical protein [Oscillospiraceae bacterium]